MNVGREEFSEGHSSTWIYDAFSFLQANAWYIVITSFLLYYLWTKKLSQDYAKWRKTREENEEEQERKKNPDKYAAWEKARMSAVDKLQNKYNDHANKMKEIFKEKEEKKRQEFISRYSTTSGRKLNDDYSPLMDNGRSSYRATRRTCPGGSCGGNR